MKDSNLLFYILVGIVVFAAIQSGGSGLGPYKEIPPPANFVLPITLHSDGHYYDANGKLVS